jgi:hypothetical protein
VVDDSSLCVIATRGYLINFFDRTNSVTTLEFNLIEAVLDTFCRLRLPTISRVSVGSVVPMPILLFAPSIVMCVFAPPMF